MSFENNNLSNNKLRFLVAVNALPMAVLFIWQAYTRNIDGDEGLYLEAVRLVLAGKLLYFDFFYQQMPLIPYIYAGWVKIFGLSLLSVRWLSVLLFFGAGVWMTAYVAKRCRNPLVISLVALLYYSSGMVLAWAPVFKTHPLNIFCLVGSAITLLEWRAGGRNSLARIGLSALLLGIGINSRLTLGPYAIFFFGFIFFGNPRHRWRDSLWFTLVVAVVSVPTFYFFWKDPDQFIRFNLTYHTKIFPGVVGLEKRLITARNVFLPIQMSVLLGLAQVGVLMRASRGWKEFLSDDTSFWGAALFIFIAVHMSAAEPFTQYFSAAVPFAILAGLPVLEWIRARLRAWGLGLFALLVAVYLSGSRDTQYFEIFSVGSMDKSWALDTILPASQVAKRIIPQNEDCLTWWPGYAVMAGCRSPAGNENHMRNHAIHVGIPGTTLEKYKMMSEERLIEDLTERRYPYIIEGVYRIRGPYADYMDVLIEENYRMVTQVRGVKIYKARSKLLKKVVGESLQGSTRKGEGQGTPKIGMKAGSRLSIHRSQR